MDVLEYSLPLSWRKEMTYHDFYSTKEGMKPFVEFCTHIESTESIQQKEKPTSSSHHYNKKQTNTKRPYDPPSSNVKKDYYCKIHGSNMPHDTKDCKLCDNNKHRYQLDNSECPHDCGSDIRLPRSTKELNVIITHQIKHLHCHFYRF